MLKLTFILSSFVVALTIWSPANAEPPPGIVKYTYWTPPENAYPWDSTSHPACSDEKRKRKPPLCKKEPDWPDYTTTKERVMKLIYETKVELLSRAEKELAYNRNRFPTGEYVFEAWNDAMGYFRAPDADNNRANISNAWIKVQKGEGFSVMSKAFLQYAEGTSPAVFNYFETKKNSPGAIVNYLKSLKAADATLDSVAPKVKETALWFEYKLRILYQLPESKATAEKIFKQAVQVWPDYPPLYGIAYAYSSPQYGGSNQAMENIMDMAIKKSKTTTGMAMYPLLTISSWTIPGYDSSLSYSRMDWELMKQGFKDYEKHLGGSLSYFFKFAELACKKQDKDTARHFFERHKEKLKEKSMNDPFAASALSQKNKCRDWAFSKDDTQQSNPQDTAPLLIMQPGI
jgi:tetratricopeptide (TPR) repeat protein